MNSRKTMAEIIREMCPPETESKKHSSLCQAHGGLACTCGFTDRLFREAANRSHERMVALCNTFKAKIEELTLKLAHAEIELQDWRDSAARAAGEQCGGERHCNCVGALRKELKSTRHNSDQFFQLWQAAQNELEKLRLICDPQTELEAMDMIQGVRDEAYDEAAEVARTFPLGDKHAIIGAGLIAAAIKRLKSNKE